MTPEQKQPAEATPVSERPARGYATPAATGRAVVVGLAADVPRALVHPAVGSAGPFVVAGVVTVSEDDENVREHAESLHHLLREHRAGVVLVAGPLGPETMRAVGDIAMLHGCRLLAVMPSEIIPGYEPMVVWEGASPLIQLSEFHRAKWQYRLKRLLDLVGSALGIVVLAPFFLLIALGIKLDTPGPALFEHWRVGRRGRGFHCLKFRTMRADAEEVLERNEELKALYRENHFKLPEQLDPRVTRVGRFLRRTSLDELPQLFNVLSGEMSLVGPRPVVEAELEHYRGSERLLLSVRPGMTGAWAVNGRHHVGYPARAELELRYVRGWSLRRDLRILAGTVGAVMDPGSERE